MVTERAAVENAVCALVVCNCGIAEIDGRFRGALSEFAGVFVEVIEIILDNVSNLL